MAGPDQSISPAFKNYLEDNRNNDIQIFWDSNHNVQGVRGYAMRGESLQAMADAGRKTLFLELPREFNDVLEAFNNGKMSPAQFGPALAARFNELDYGFFSFDADGKPMRSDAATRDGIALLAGVMVQARKAGVAVLGIDKMDYTLGIEASGGLEMRVLNDKGVTRYALDELAKRGGKAAIIYGVMHGAFREPHTQTYPMTAETRAQLNEQLKGPYADLVVKQLKDVGITIAKDKATIYDNGGIDDGFSKQKYSVAQVIMTPDGVPWDTATRLPVFNVTTGAFAQGGVAENIVPRAQPSFARPLATP